MWRWTDSDERDLRLEDYALSTGQVEAFYPGLTLDDLHPGAASPADLPPSAKPVSGPAAPRPHLLEAA